MPAKKKRKHKIQQKRNNIHSLTYITYIHPFPHVTSHKPPPQPHTIHNSYYNTIYRPIRRPFHNYCLHTLLLFYNIYCTHLTSFTHSPSSYIRRISFLPPTSLLSYSRSRITTQTSQLSTNMRKNYLLKCNILSPS